MRVLIVNDIHVADRPPSSCTDAYTEDLLDLLGQTVAEAVSHQVSCVVWTGDVFHSKSPLRTSHRLVQKLIGIIKAYHVPVYIVPGNHDIQHDNLGSIHDTQPLGVLYRAGARMLTGWCPAFPQLYGVPWQQDWSDETVFEALHDFRDGGPVPGNQLVCAHAPLYPPGHELPYEYYPAEKWAEAMGGRGHVAYGHVHEYHGTWECGGVTFHNPGALSRGALHEYNMTRPVKVSVWDSSDGQFTEIELTAKPASEVFRLREKQQLTDTAGKLDEFLQSIGGTRLTVLSVEAVREQVRGMGLDQDVEDEVAELLEWAVHQ